MADQQLIQDVLILQTTIIKAIDSIPYRVIEYRGFKLPRKHYYYYGDICKLLKIDNTNESPNDIPDRYKAEFLIMDLDGNTVKSTYIDGYAVLKLLMFKSPLSEEKKHMYAPYIQLS